MDWRRVIGGLGRTLITAGTLILLFVAYQLWGTGLAEARSQDDLRDDLARLLEDAPVRPPDTAPDAPPPTFPDAPPPAPEGTAVAIIRIPKIKVDKAIVQGVSLKDLKKGPGHYPATPMPGQPGNAAIAGHRTTYGAPFFELNELNQGDTIFVTTTQGAFEYRVREKKVVRPTEVSVLDPTTDNRLTLTTCEPRYSAAKRLIVVSDLVGPAAPAPPPSDVPPAPGADEEPGVDGPAAFEEAGLSGDPAARGPAFLWGLFAALIWLGAWVLSRKWRKWPAYLVASPFFFVVLFIFFENFSRLLPANF